jgi:hypothetical protein
LFDCSGNRAFCQAKIQLEALHGSIISSRA